VVLQQWLEEVDGLRIKERKMADASNFMHLYSAQIQNFVNLLIDLQTKNQQLTEDPTLVTRYFDVTVTPGHRTDIVETDVSNAQAAIVQMLFTYNSGTPTQAAALLKMFP
jgi:hypothetical protein